MEWIDTLTLKRQQVTVVIQGAQLAKTGNALVTNHMTGRRRMLEQKVIRRCIACMNIKNRVPQQLADATCEQFVVRVR